MSCTQFTAHPLWEIVVSLDELRALKEHRVMDIEFCRHALLLLSYHRGAAITVALDRAEAAKDRGDLFGYHEWERMARYLKIVIARMPR